MRGFGLIVYSVLVMVMMSGCDRPVAKGMMKPPEGPAEITLTEVRTSDFKMDISTNGKVEAFNTVQVYSRMNGFLGERKYREGGFVKEGSILFTMDKSDLANALSVAKANYELTVSNNINAVTILKRDKILLATNSISQQEVDVAITAKDNTKALKDAAFATYQQAQLNMTYTNVVAPVTGFVDQAKVDRGAYVTVGQNSWLTTMYQTDKVYVNFSLSENQKQIIERDYRAGMLGVDNLGHLEISITMGDGSTLIRRGVIDYVSPAVDSSTGSVAYRAIVDNKDNRLMPGQFVKIGIEGIVWKNSMFVNKKTILSNDKGKFVYVLDKNSTVTQKQVNVGAWVGENALIESGLDGTEQIADSGLARLKQAGQVIVKGK